MVATSWLNWAPLITAQHGPLEAEVVSSPPGWTLWTGVSSCSSHYSPGPSRTCCVALQRKAFPHLAKQSLVTHRQLMFFLLPYNNAELHSSHAYPRLVRFIIFTRLQLCHLHFLSSLGTICFVKLAEGKAADAAVLQSGRVRSCAAGASCLLVLWIISSLWNKRSTFSASAGEYQSISASPLSKGQWCPTIWHNPDRGGLPPLGVCGESLRPWAIFMMI